MNQIHPSAVIGPNVEIGNNNIIGPNSVLLGPLKLGDNNWIGPSVVIGTPPQSRGHEHPRPWDESLSGKGIEIGSRNIIREFATVQSPTKGITKVGNDCFLMTQIHIPHDAVIGHRVTIANSSHIAGHCVIQDDVTLGLSTSIHQFTVVGKGAMVGMGSIVTRDVPPFAMVFGAPSKLKGCNRIGMKRQGIDDSVIESLDDFYRHNQVREVNDVDEYKSSNTGEIQLIFAQWIDAVTKVRD